MATNDLNKEYKELYLSELARREELNKAVDRPIAIITAFAGIVYFSVGGFRLPLSAFQGAQLTLAVLAGMLLISAIVCIVCSYYGRVYGYVPTPSELENYRKSLTTYYADDNSVSAADIEEKVLDYVYEAYVTGAHQNASINVERGAWLHRAKTLLVIFALPLIIVLGVLRIISNMMA